MSLGIISIQGIPKLVIEYTELSQKGMLLNIIYL